MGHSAATTSFFDGGPVQEGPGDAISVDATWAIIDELAAWTLDESERDDYLNLVSEATTSLDAEQLQLFQDWAASKLSLGKFLNKHGLSYLKGLAW